MTTAEFLATLRERDVRLWVEEGRLRCSAPAGALDNEMKAALASRKNEIIAVLRRAEAIKGGPSAIIPLKPQGRRPPLFAVPGHNGDIFCYLELARHLDADQPLLGIQPPGLDGSKPFRSIEELASYEVRQIRQYRPQGPYLVAGYCAGGTVAFEIARQLTEQGQHVALLALIGSSFPTLYRWRSRVVFRAGDLVARAQRHLRVLASNSLAEGTAYIKARAQMCRDERTARTQESRNPLARNRRRVEHATITGIRKYRLRPYPGRIDLFLASEAGREWGGLPHQWRSMASVLHEHVGSDDCGLDSMLKEPHVVTLATVLGPLLANAALRSEATGLLAVKP